MNANTEVTRNAHMGTAVCLGTTASTGSGESKPLLPPQHSKTPALYLLCHGTRMKDLQLLPS